MNGSNICHLSGFFLEKQISVRLTLTILKIKVFRSRILKVFLDLEMALIITILLRNNQMMLRAIIISRSYCLIIFTLSRLSISHFSFQFNVFFALFFSVSFFIILFFFEFLLIIVLLSLYWSDHDIEWSWRDGSWSRSFNTLGVKSFTARKLFITLFINCRSSNSQSWYWWRIYVLKCLNCLVETNLCRVVCTSQWCIL